MEGFSDIFTGVAAFGAILAALVAYLALYRNSKPHILIYYEPSPDIPSLINLVISNIGSGNAIGVKFSTGIPVRCWGIEAPTSKGKYIPESGFPMLSPGQKYTFDGGQLGGLQSKLGAGLRLRISYQYKNPIGCLSDEDESFILGVNHLEGMPTRISGDQAIVEALKGPNKTTIHEIRDELKKINSSFSKIAKLISENNIEPKP